MLVYYRVPDWLPIETPGQFPGNQWYFLYERINPEKPSLPSIPSPEEVSEKSSTFNDF